MLVQRFAKPCVVHNMSTQTIVSERIHDMKGIDRYGTCVLALLLCVAFAGCAGGGGSKGKKGGEGRGKTLARHRCRRE